MRLSTVDQSVISLFDAWRLDLVKPGESIHRYQCLFKLAQQAWQAQYTFQLQLRLLDNIAHINSAQTFSIHACRTTDDWVATQGA